MSVKENLKSYIKYEQMKINEFEESIGVSNGYVNSIHKSIGVDKIVTIIENYPNLNIEWLFTGKGEMLKKEPNPEYSSITRLVAIHKEHLEDKNTIIKRLEAEIKKLREQLTFQGRPDQKTAKSVRNKS